MRYLDTKTSDAFIGTGGKNENGESLQEFLDSYDPNKYQHPSNTVDILVFTYMHEAGKKKLSRLLMIKRRNHPGIGWWALPGGFVEFKENLDEAARRELKEETGLEHIEVEQLGCYGDYDRDPRTRIITTAYVALIEEGEQVLRAGDDAADAAWFCIQDKVLESDHNRQLYCLNLTNQENNIKLSADVEVTWKNGILKNIKYRVINRDQICADHGAIILHGYHYVRNILENQGENQYV